MTLPSDWRVYYRLIDERCRDLIDYGIWSGISLSIYKAWLNNFVTDEEKYLSVRILDSMIYRSEEHVKSMIYDNLYVNINNEFRLKEPPFSNEDSFPQMLMDRRNDPQIRIVLTLRKEDRPGKSAHIIGRLIDREFNVVGKYIIHPWEVSMAYNEQNVKTFIFIDDFAGTGNTFCESFKQCGIANEIEAYFIFAPLVIHEEAVKNINFNFPRVKICYAEKLNYNNSFFNYSFGEEIEHGEEVKEFYIKFVKKKMKKSKTQSLGYGGLEILYSFQHACPNNSLPILYHDINWNPLFKR